MSIAGNCETAWLDVDFGRQRTVDQVTIYTNRYWKKVDRFELQRLVEGNWQTFYSNDDLGTGTLKLKFPPVTLSQVRMKLTMKGAAYIEAYKLELSDAAQAGDTQQ